MHPFDEMKRWVGFSEADQATLRSLWGVVEPRLDHVTTRFYDQVLASPGAAAVLEDAAQIERLRVTLRVWVQELLLGPWDLAYYARRERIGRVHVEVGLAHRYMFTAMNVMRQTLVDIAQAAGRSDADAAIARVCDMDLAIMTGTYMERREERQLSTLQELIVSRLPVTVLLLDPEGRVSAATRPGMRLFGEGDLTGRPWQDALPTTLLEAADLPAQVARALATGREIALPRVDTLVDGQPRNFKIAIVPLEHPNARAMLHVEELTEAIVAESRLARAESLAQLGALSAAVAHELRNPLAGISGAIQVIAASLPADDRRKPIMEKVEQQVRRLDVLVTDLLQFARPAEPRLSDVALHDAARAVAELVRREHPDVDIAVEGEGRARADGNLVQQVLLNLAQNAVQAQEGTGKVRLLVATGRVRVVDAGPGISAENMENIYKPFFTTKTRGTGLGLAICRKLVGAMGGRLEVEPGPLPGACFVVSLPPA